MRGEECEGRQECEGEEGEGEGEGGCEGNGEGEECERRGCSMWRV